MMRPRHYTFTVPARLDQLAAMCAQVVAFVRQSAQPEPGARTLYDIELAVNELATNIVTHAYTDSVGTIEVALKVTRRVVIIETRDTGRAFRLDDVPLPDLDQGQMHGYGVFLMRSLLDDVQYSHKRGVNRWRLEKRLRHES